MDSAPLDRARRLAPLIAASAEQAERERRLPEPVVTALLEADLFRMLLPGSLDGGARPRRAVRRCGGARPGAH